LVIGILGMFVGIASSRPVVAGDAAATAANLLGSAGLFRAGLVAWFIVLATDIAVAVTLAVLLASVNRTVSLAAAAFRIVYAAMQGVNLSHLFAALSFLTGSGAGAVPDAAGVQVLALQSLEAFGTGFLVSLVFFGIHLLLLGYLLYASRYIPRVL